MPCAISMSLVVSGRVPPPNADKFSAPNAIAQSAEPDATACQARLTAEAPLAHAFSTVKTG